MTDPSYEELQPYIDAAWDGRMPQVDAFVAPPSTDPDLPAILRGRYASGAFFVMKAWIGPPASDVEGDVAYILTESTFPGGLEASLTNAEIERLRFANLEVNTPTGLVPARDLPQQHSLDAESRTETGGEELQKGQADLPPVIPADREIPPDVAADLGGGW